MGVLLQERRPRRERADNAARRRAQILDATIESIVRHGLSATTLATVAEEAGLSQGVTVFYFKTKQALLAEALRWHYEEYRKVWRAALEAAPADPIARILALVRADFDPAICNRRTLTLWHAYWGEATARPLFASISEAFDRERGTAMHEQCDAAADLLDQEVWSAAELAVALDSLTDGLWLRMHLDPDSMDNARAHRTTLRTIAAAFPSRHAEILTAGR
ncbi:MAG: TetR family transcriptional regulator C-terminal domain-containing protein [Geminicoccaceae bacterium]